MKAPRMGAAYARTCVAAIVLAIAVVALFTWVLLDRIASPRTVQSGMMVKHGTSVWIFGGADALGLRWRNAQQTGILQSAREDLGGSDGEWSDGISDGWCELSPAPMRTGSLAVGWPSPWIIWRFSSEKPTDSFPPSPEVADQIQVLTTAANRVLAGEGNITMNFSTTLSAVSATVPLAVFVWWLLVMRLIRRRLKRGATQPAVTG